MSIVKDYWNGPTHIIIDDSAYKGKSKEELDKKWANFCETYRRLYVSQELKRRREKKENEKIKQESTI